jgi:phosphoserine phosphatase RsbU/P
LSEPPVPSAKDAAEDFEDLFEHAPCGYLVLNPDGVVSRTNLTLSHWLGVSPRGITGRRFRDLLTLPGRILYETNLAPHLRLHGEFEEISLDLMDGEGQPLAVLANAVERRSADGALTSVRVTVFRAKDRMSYERTLQGRESTAVQHLKDEKSTAELREQFIAVLGHDLRNPIASIAGAARLLRREAPSEKSLKVIEMMEASVDRMAGLIDNVMDFARGRLGRGIDLQTERAQLEPVLRHVVAELESSHPSRIFICDYDLPVPIRFDTTRIGQLVSNLLGNALTHGDPKQPVRLCASTTTNELEISVSNSGDPISAAAMERLFQPFFRGEVRSSQQGLGLGLHIASEIAKAHGGSLTVRSDAAETRFTFTMPLT